MSCCGKNREQFRESVQASQTFRSGAGTSSQSGRNLRFRICFEYLGTTGLTVLGAITGKRYRFHGSGAVVEVDPRDRRSLSAVPKLRQV